MRKLLHCVAAAALAAVASGAAAAGPATRHVDELMRKSGSWTQLAQTAPLIQAGIAEQVAQERAQGGPRALDDAALAALQAAAATAYAPSRLRADFKEEIANTLSAEDEARALEWLSAEPGKRFTRLEEESGEPAEAERTRNAAAEFATKITHRRRFLLERLVAAVNGGESSASVMIDLTLGIAYGIAGARAPRDTAAADALRGKLEQQRTQIAATFAARLVEGFAYTYRSMADEDLERYVEFAESNSGRAYHKASAEAYEKTMARAALNFGAELGAMAARAPRSS